MSSAPSVKDLRMIKRFVLLPLLMSELEDNKAAIAKAVKYPEPYEALLQEAMDRVAADLLMVKDYLRRNDTKIESAQWKDGCVSAKFVCRGHVDVFHLMDHLLKNDMNTAMNHYLRKP
ncbi:hypothetical protein J2T17_006351 [Paenibacillus mucilaginosus]|uniref:hypothetical protein n=1 Tax=Paenibacillus mucilaginosus TaxID=61624 RepID=UPI003D1E2E32